VLLALIYLLLRRLVALVGGSSDARHDDVEVLVLRHQLAVLRRQVGRPRLRRPDRLYLAALSRAHPGKRWSSFLIRPQTLLRWHRELVRRKWTYRHRLTGVDRRSPPTLVTLSCEWDVTTLGGGCLRIKGELAKLGVRVSATAIPTLLRRHGLGPASRRSGPPWSQFLRSQARGVLAADLLHRGDGVAAHAVGVLRHRGPHQVRPHRRSDEASRYRVGDPTGPEPLLRPVRAWAVPVPDPRSRRQVPEQL
jgi:putative transposase